MRGSRYLWKREFRELNTEGLVECLYKSTLSLSPSQNSSVPAGAGQLPLPNQAENQTSSLRRWNRDQSIKVIRPSWGQGHSIKISQAQLGCGSGQYLPIHVTSTPTAIMMMPLQLPVTEHLWHTSLCAKHYACIVSHLIFKSHVVNTILYLKKNFKREVISSFIWLSSSQLICDKVQF